MIKQLSITCIHPSPNVIATLQQTYFLHALTERKQIIPTLVKQQPALILINGDHPEWREWVVTIISNNATRRTPLIVYAELLDSFHRQASQSGITAVISQDKLISDHQQIIQQYARYLTPEESQQLDCDCQAPLPPTAQQAVEQFNAGQYYRQHDLFEVLWMETQSPVRELYRAILQVGIAYYQITRNNRNGAIKMLERSRQWLNQLPDVCQGVDIAKLREDSYQVYRHLLEITHISEFDQQLLQPIKQIKP
jgi:predicted metal-dependent hydrolase